MKYLKLLDKNDLRKLIKYVEHKITDNHRNGAPVERTLYFDREMRCELQEIDEIEVELLYKVADLQKEVTKKRIHSTLLYTRI